jgi:hypothetical protein
VHFHFTNSAMFCFAHSQILVIMLLK